MPNGRGGVARTSSSSVGGSDAENITTTYAPAEQVYLEFMKERIEAWILVASTSPYWYTEWDPIRSGFVTRNRVIPGVEGFGNGTNTAIADWNQNVRVWVIEMILAGSTNIPILGGIEL